MPTALVTGASRGLGLEWVRQYAAEGWRVHAACRHPAEAGELLALAKAHPQVHVHRLDVTRPDEVRSLAAALRDEALDVLVANAGVNLEPFERDDLGSLRYEDWRLTLEVNTLGAVRVVEAMVERLAAAERPVVAAISSHMGSIADIEAPGSYFYRSSKAALNAVMRGIAASLRPRGIGVLLLHPGWVRTRIGGPRAPLEPAESVRGMRALVAGFRLERTGSFLRYDGTPMPW